MRARLALAVSRQSCELREVVLRNKPVELLQASPKGTVPVLVLPDGTVIEQSLDIMLWALQRNDPQHWLEPPTGTLGDMLGLIADCDSRFKHGLDRYKYPQRSKTSILWNSVSCAAPGWLIWRRGWRTKGAPLPGPASVLKLPGCNLACSGHALRWPTLPSCRLYGSLLRSTGLGSTASLGLHYMVGWQGGWCRRYSFRLWKNTRPGPVARACVFLEGRGN